MIREIDSWAKHQSKEEAKGHETILSTIRQRAEFCSVKWLRMNIIEEFYWSFSICLFDEFRENVKWINEVTVLQVKMCWLTNISSSQLLCTTHTSVFWERIQLLLARDFFGKQNKGTELDLYISCATWVILLKGIDVVWHRCVLSGETDYHVWTTRKPIEMLIACNKVGKAEKLTPRGGFEPPISNFHGWRATICTTREATATE